MNMNQVSLYLNWALLCVPQLGVTREQDDPPKRKALVVQAYRRVKDLRFDLASQSAAGFANGPRDFAKELLRANWVASHWATQRPLNPPFPADETPTEPNLRGYLKDMSKLKPEDQVLVVLVGPIIMLEEEGKQHIFFCPQDAEYENLRKREDVKPGNHLIPLHDIYSAFQNCPSRKKLLVLVTALTVSPWAEKYKQPICARLPKLPAPPVGLCVWTSCAEGEYTSRRAEFMEFLTEGLSGLKADGVEKGTTRDGAVTCQELFQYTKEKVEKESQSEGKWSYPQHPTVLGDMPRDWVLAGKPAGTRWKPLTLPFPEREAKKGQEEVARALKLDSPFVTNGLGLKLAVVPPGAYRMGSDKGYDDEKPRPSIHLPRPFLLGVYEITQDQYERVMGDNPSAFRGEGQNPAAYPVERVTFKQAILFCNALSRGEKLEPYYKLIRPVHDDRTGKVTGFEDYAPSGGRGYRLPTEAEWEWACRAGTDTAFSFGDDLDSKKANIDAARPGGVTDGVYLGRTAKVGSYAPNTWGLYDMHGNVAERVEESYDPTRYKLLSLSVTDGSGGVGYGGLARGGAWNFPPKDCRSAVRLSLPPDTALKFVGFRVARDLD